MVTRINDRGQLEVLHDPTGGYVPMVGLSVDGGVGVSLIQTQAAILNELLTKLEQTRQLQEAIASIDTGVNDPANGATAKLGAIALDLAALTDTQILSLQTTLSEISGKVLDYSGDLGAIATSIDSAIAEIQELQAINSQMLTALSGTSTFLPVLTTLTLTNASQYYAFAVPAGARSLVVRDRAVNTSTATLSYSYDGGSTYNTIAPGSEFFTPPELPLGSGLTLSLASSVAGTIAEISYFTKVA